MIRACRTVGNAREGPSSVRWVTFAIVAAHISRADNVSSSPGEFHPQALTEPYVNLSVHTAPVIQSLKRLCLGGGLLPLARLTLPLGRMTPPLCSSRSPGLRRYYGRLRPCASLRYFHPRGASTWISPLSSRRQVPTFRTRACVGLTPPICRTPLGQSAGSPRACPGALKIAPVSTSSVSFFDMSSVVRLHSSSRHAPDAVTPRLFSQRSPPRLLTAAAWDGLKPAPASRLRGAYPHLSCSYDTSFPPSRAAWLVPRGTL